MDGFSGPDVRLGAWLTALWVIFFAGTQQEDRWMRRFSCNLTLCHDDGVAAGNRHDDFQQVQRRSDHRRSEHVLNRCRLSVEYGIGIALRIGTGLGRDQCVVFRRTAIGRHMRLHEQRIGQICPRCSEGNVEFTDGVAVR